MHGGTVWLESQPDVGTEVFFRLPRASQQARSAA
jgi:signal transduction histidine kinase